MKIFLLTLGFGLLLFAGFYTVYTNYPTLYVHGQAVALSSGLGGFVLVLYGLACPSR